MDGYSFALRRRSLLNLTENPDEFMDFSIAEQAGDPQGGTVNLIGTGRDKAQEGRPHEGLCPSGHAGDRGPGLKGLGPGGSVLGGREVISAEVEQVVDVIVRRESVGPDPLT